jgi:hypothetical protein
MHNNSRLFFLVNRLGRMILYYYIDMAHGIYIYEECISIMLYNQMVKKQPFYIPLHCFCYGLFI